MINLFGTSVPINDPIPVELDANTFRFTQLDYADSLVQSMFPKEQYDFLRKVNIQQVGLDRWRDEKGMAWAKRLTKYASLLKMKLNPDRVSILAEKMGKIANAPEKLFIEFTDHANWRPGEFGEATNSCWFDGGSYNSARKNLIAKGGGAVRFYDADHAPRGRCWYWPLDSTCSAIFNIYDKQGQMTMASLARIIAIMYDVQYIRLIETHFPNAYVNGSGATYMIGRNLVQRPVSFLFSAKVYNDVSQSGFGMDTTVTRSSKKCAWCEESLEAEETVDTVDGLVCTECDDNHSRRCNSCGTIYHEDDDRCSYYDVTDCDLCRDCRDERITECDNCSGWELNESIIVVDDEHHYCSSCADRHTTTCPDCGDSYRNDSDVWRVVYSRPGSESARVCESCISDYDICEVCDERFVDGHCTPTEDGFDLCSTHRQSHGHECGGCDNVYYIMENLITHQENEHPEEEETE